jgi:hypothetical protein
MPAKLAAKKVMDGAGVIVVRVGADFRPMVGAAGELVNGCDCVSHFSTTFCVSRATHSKQMYPSARFCQSLSSVFCIASSGLAQFVQVQEFLQQAQRMVYVVVICGTSIVIPPTTVSCSTRQSRG